MAGACVRAPVSVERGVSERCTSVPALRIAQWSPPASRGEGTISNVKG
jgi:hypothetical protein